MIIEHFTFMTMVYLGILLPIIALGTVFGLRLFEKEMDYLDLENKRVILEKELQQSEYMQLNQQIQPHFLFNTLNAFLSLARLGRNEDMIKAMETFSRFLRYKYEMKSSLIPFSSELEHTKNYLSIQKLRFGNRLVIHYDLDPQAFDTLIPPYTLQTFVENAFKHGLEKKQGEKYLSISLQRIGNWVKLVVINNGPEIERQSLTSQLDYPGTGLKNIRKRFDLLFDLASSVQLRINERGMTEVQAVWPYTPEGNIDESTDY